MSVNPSPIGGYAAQFFDNNGVILSGGKIYTYAAGTTTPQATYTSASGVTPHANPIVLDSAGRVPGGEIWLTDGLVYKFVIETSTAILIGSYDNITGVNSNFVNYTVQEEVITATAGQTVFNLSTINYTPGTNSLTVYIDGVNQYVGESYLETDSNTVTFTSGVHVGGEVKFTTAIQTTTGAVNASIVAYDPPFTGGVATNVEAKLSEYVSVKDFGAVGDGVTDDTAAIQAAFDSGQSIYIPDGNYVSGPLTVQDITVFGSGTLVGSSGVAAAALLTATNATLQNFKIDSGTYTLYGIQGGDGAHVKGITFSGDYGHCVLMSNAQSISIVDCVVLEGGTQTTPFVINSCIDTLVANNIIEDHTGFGIQTRFSTLTTITGNVIKQQYFSQSFTASSTTETFTFTTGRSCQRFSAFSNGAFRVVTGSVEITPTEYDVTVTGLTIGQTVVLYGFVGLESIQANSGCNSVIISDNSVFHSGDSGILCGADYHWNGSSWVLNPGAVVESDYPRNITISNNNVVGPVLASGIALNNAVAATVTGNTISDIGYTELTAYKVGISCGLISDCVIRDNITDGANTHTLACVKYTGGGLANPENAFGFNRGISCKNYEFFPTTDPAARRFGYSILDAQTDDLITRSIETMLDSAWTSGNYTGNNISVSISGGSGIGKDNSVTYAYWTSIRTYAGQYADLGINASTLNLFANNLVRVSFYAKVDTSGDDGYLSLFYDFPGDDPEPRVTIPVTSTSWSYFSVTMALGDIDALYVRIGGTTGVARLSRLRIDMLDVEV